MSNSEDWLSRSLKVIPTGSQTYSKSYKYFSKPIFADYGKWGFLYDVDGNEYHDFILSLGAVILGYRDIDVDNLEGSGVIYSVPHPLEVQLAEKLVEIIPSAEMVKFFKNGSDACEIAVRLARAYTGRDDILVGSYHGFHDWYVSSIDRNKGVPVLYDYSHSFNNIDDYEFHLKEDEVAAIIVEPTIPDLDKIVTLARENGVLIIFDEVLTGFRYNIGGLQTLLGITPDLTCLGKCMANGLPLSAVVGRRDIMQLMDDRGGVFASSTFGGETLSLATALKTIEELEKNGQRLWHLGGKWGSLMDILIRKKNLTQIMKVEGMSPRCGVKFSDEGSMKAIEFQSLYQQELLKRKILTHSINNYCLDHTDEQIDYFIEQADEVLDIIGKAYKENNVFKYLDNGVLQVMFKR